MNMKEFSCAVGLSSYTLRYYEKIGLLKHVHRNSSGHRVYTHRDNLIEHIRQQNEHLKRLEEKINLYKSGKVR
ncbi:TPA: MerR family DNA-binding transcriptional regulator [Vibrio parahaemolyticus]|nr:MerR family DNA-binding transcriptional regulator [Vibrio parahaemolyticus]